jgi:histidinol dehydrogenase
VKVEWVRWDGADAESAARSLRATQPEPEEVTAAVAQIVRDVARRGDAAVRELTQRIDSVQRLPESWRVEPNEIERASAAMPGKVRAAIELAAANIASVAEAELGTIAPVQADLTAGQRVSVIETAVGAAGVYAPRGAGAYPSTVLMCCLPARAAGVGRVAVASPPDRNGRVHNAVLAACAAADVDEVYAIGGAQAIAALALGTASVPRVDLIAGPGNRYVVEAKRMLSARVGIDGIAGPTELVVVADGSAAADWVALDLCAQAEHGTEGLLVALSPADELLERVGALIAEVAAERPSIPDATVFLVSAPGSADALVLADALAPEHLELQLSSAEERTARERIAGCVFVGSRSGAAFGDYAAGSNHVLPTGGAARFGRPLGVRSFMRGTSIVSIPPEAAPELAPAVGELARAEGFPVHGESAEARAGENGTSP